MHLSKLQILYCTNDEKHLTSHGPRKPHSNSFFSLVLTCQRWHLSHLHSRTNAYSQVFWLIQWDFQGTPNNGTPFKKVSPLRNCRNLPSKAELCLAKPIALGAPFRSAQDGWSSEAWNPRIPSERSPAGSGFDVTGATFVERGVGGGRVFARDTLVGVGCGWSNGRPFSESNSKLTLRVDDQVYDVAVMFSLVVGMHAILACLFYVYLYDVCIYNIIYIYCLYIYIHGVYI